MEQDRVMGAKSAGMKDHDARQVLIEAENITVKAGAKLLLDDISLTIARGEIVTVIGPNGAGKSTLVKALLGIITPTSGTVKMMPGLKVGYVPQRFAAEGLIPLDVRRLLTLAAGATRPQVDAAMVETGIEHLAASDVSVLSGGELQRVLLARALVCDPDVLVLDEPVRGVDFSGEIKLYGLIAEIRGRSGCGILMVSHDLHVVMAESDRIICLNRHICCQGRPEAVRHHPEYTGMFGSAAAVVGLYTHAHDHAHDVSGEIEPIGDGADKRQNRGDK